MTIPLGQGWTDQGMSEIWGKVEKLKESDLEFIIMGSVSIFIFII